jgi:uncharacterized protein YndB with AHSA1/START domain
MPAIVEKCLIEAAPQRVWEALMRSKQIEKWWADEARVQPEVGGLAPVQDGTEVVFTHEGVREAK